MKTFSLSLIAIGILASGCGGPGDGSPVDSGESLSHVEAAPSPALRSLMVCTGEASGAQQRYEVYTWEDGSVLATCQVSDARREASGNRLYGAGDGSAEAAAVSGGQAAGYRHQAAGPAVDLPAA